MPASKFDVQMLRISHRRKNHTDDKADAAAEVVVDNFAEARQRDVLNLAEEMEDNLDKDTKLLEEPCRNCLD